MIFMFDEKRNQALTDLKHLWKLDDSAWMAERKSQWKELSGNGLLAASAKEQKKLNDLCTMASNSQSQRGLISSEKKFGIAPLLRINLIEKLWMRFSPNRKASVRKE